MKIIKRLFLLLLLITFIFFSIYSFFGWGKRKKKTVNLSFWNMPFVTQEVSPEYVKKWETDIKSSLPNSK